jgi:hypothetical protein
VAAGWLGPDDILFPLGWARPRAWRTSTGVVTAEPASPVAVSEKRGLVSGVMERTRGSDVLCVAAWKVVHPDHVLWDGCLARAGRLYTSDLRGSFSPDGRLLADHTAYLGRGVSQPFIAVIDSQTGAVVARLDQGNDDGSFRGPQYAVQDLKWEDDTHLLLVVADRTLATQGQAHQIQPLEAVVRCDVTTVTCELATPPARTSPGRTAAYGLVG